MNNSISKNKKHLRGKIKRILLASSMSLLSLQAHAASGYDEIFSPLKEIQNILRYAGTIILVLALIAQGIVIFFSDNIPESVKKTVGKVAVGGIFIGGASAISGFILPNSISFTFEALGAFHA